MKKQFVKSSYCGASSPTCVEVRRSKRVVHVRDSKDRRGATLSFNHEEWKDFLKGAIAGEFRV
jgi:hypothetical protein